MKNSDGLCQIAVDFKAGFAVLTDLLKRFGNLRAQPFVV
jgi:hypothetical protein